MNSKNNKTSKAQFLIVNLTDNLDLRVAKNSLALSNLTIYYTWENIKSSYNNNKFTTSALTWNDKTQDYFLIR